MSQRLACTEAAETSPTAQGAQVFAALYYFIISRAGLGGRVREQCRL